MFVFCFVYLIVVCLSPFIDSFIRSFHSLNSSIFSLSIKPYNFAGPGSGAAETKTQFKVLK
jgi:hypothetical protein